MTNSKAYNLRTYCKLINREQDSDEGKEFLAKTILEQLTIIKNIREAMKEPEPDPEPVQEPVHDYSIMNSIFKKIN